MQSITSPQGVAVKIGLVLPLAEYPWKQPSYAEIRTLAGQAEAAGFDSLWAFDHLLFRDERGSTEGIWECWTVLSALAEATSRVELGSFVLCTAFRNPAVLAKMAVTLDEVSRGRLILGLGAGWHQPEFEAFGVPYDARVARMEDALQIITALFRHGRVDHDSRFHRIRHGELRPRGPRPAGPPILVGGFRPRLLRLAATYADMWNGCWFGPAESFAESLERIRLACKDVGRDAQDLAVTVGVNVAVLDERHPRAHAPDGAAVLAGSADEVAEGLVGYARLGVDHLILNLNPHDSAAQQRLAGAVRVFRQLSGAKE